MILSKTEIGLKVVQIEGKGRGVISTQPFSKGSYLCEYSGELIRKKEALERETIYSQDPTIGCYLYFFVHKGVHLWYVHIKVSL